MSAVPAAAADGVPWLAPAFGPWPRERSVFINFPYDREYRPLSEAIVFADFEYGGTDHDAVASVQGWLKGYLRGGRLGFLPKAVIAVLPEFRDTVAVQRDGWYDRLPWEDLVDEGCRLALRHGLCPGPAS